MKKIFVSSLMLVASLALAHGGGQGSCQGGGQGKGHSSKQCDGNGQGKKHQHRYGKNKQSGSESSY